MSYWIIVIGSKVTKENFDKNTDVWFCLPPEAQVGDMVLSYFTLKTTKLPGVSSIYKISGKDSCKDDKCKNYGAFSGMGQGLSFVKLELVESFSEPLSNKTIKNHPLLFNFTYARRNFQATFFKITTFEFNLITELARCEK